MLSYLWIFGLNCSWGDSLSKDICALRGCGYSFSLFKDYSSVVIEHDFSIVLVNNLSVSPEQSSNNHQFSSRYGGCADCQAYSERRNYGDAICDDIFCSLPHLVGLAEFVRKRPNDMNRLNIWHKCSFMLLYCSDCNHNLHFFSHSFQRCKDTSMWRTLCSSKKTLYCHGLDSFSAQYNNNLRKSCDSAGSPQAFS